MVSTLYNSNKQALCNSMTALERRKKSIQKIIFMLVSANQKSIQGIKFSQLFWSKEPAMTIFFVTRATLATDLRNMS